MDKKETIDQEDQRLKPAVFKEAVQGVTGNDKATGDDKEDGEKSKKQLGSKSKKGQKNNPHNIGVEI